jgi:hypothetical protein
MYIFKRWKVINIILLLSQVLMEVRSEFANELCQTVGDEIFLT